MKYIGTFVHNQVPFIVSFSAETYLHEKEQHSLKHKLIILLIQWFQGSDNDIKFECQYISYFTFT